MKRDDSRTQLLLARIEQGDLDARSELMPLLYDELRRIAHALMGHQRIDHTLQTTALVHEAYLRLGASEGPSRRPRQFLALAAVAMRSILVDYSRAAHALKRDRHQRSDVALDQLAAPIAGGHSLIDVAEAIEALAKSDPGLGRIAELRIFGGLEHEEIAEELGCSARTTERRWRLARALLERRLDAH